MLQLSKRMKNIEHPVRNTISYSVNKFWAALAQPRRGVKETSRREVTLLFRCWLSKVQKAGSRYTKGASLF